MTTEKSDEHQIATDVTRAHKTLDELKMLKEHYYLSDKIRIQRLGKNNVIKVKFIIVDKCTSVVKENIHETMH
jgi:hypothetical protein